MSKPTKFKKFLKDLWYFIWEDNSIWSWLVNIILAFVIIKYLLYPGLGLVLGTQYPIVAIVSGSMEHDGNFNQWWGGDSCCTAIPCLQKSPQSFIYSDYEIDEEEFLTYPYRHGFNKGDLMVLTGPKNIKVGDIIVFRTQFQRDPIIHRVVDINDQEGNIYYTTKGDHNCGSNNFEETILPEAVIGKGSLRIRWLGWIKLGFVRLLGLTGVI